LIRFWNRENIEGENQERRRRELWRLEGRRKRENEKGVVFLPFVLIHYGRWELQYVCYDNIYIYIYIYILLDDYSLK